MNLKLFFALSTWGVILPHIFWGLSNQASTTVTVVEWRPNWLLKAFRGKNIQHKHTRALFYIFYHVRNNNPTVGSGGPMGQKLNISLTSDRTGPVVGGLHHTSCRPVDGTNAQLIIWVAPITLPDPCTGLRCCTGSHSMNISACQKRVR